jgi:hypothetical protein
MKEKKTGITQFTRKAFYEAKASLIWQLAARTTHLSIFCLKSFTFFSRKGWGVNASSVVIDHM